MADHHDPPTPPTPPTDPIYYRPTGYGVPITMTNDLAQHIQAQQRRQEEYRLGLIHYDIYGNRRYGQPQSRSSSS